MAVVLWALIPLTAVTLLLWQQLSHVYGRSRGAVATFSTVGLCGLVWWLLARGAPPDAEPADWSAVRSVPSDACVRCHEEHYASWKRTYHRTMTREATPAFVKGDFDNVTYDYQGLTTRLSRDGDTFFMETVDPRWAQLRANVGTHAANLSPPARVTLRVDRLVGSHWIQECMHRDETGRYTRLPVLYHVVEKRWVHANGAFLAPDSEDFWAQCRGSAWNDSCLYCHNTGPSKNPLRNLRGQIVAYNTEVAELGISCEACHGPGADHIRLNQNPARRLALQARRAPPELDPSAGDPSIVHPARLPVQRRDEICARCHGALVPKAAAWDARTHRDPFIAGQELLRYNNFFWSEAQQAALARGGPASADGKPLAPEPGDGRFWPDGTPLTTALEYNGMGLSACYQHGKGSLSCLTCHSMHTEDPNFLLKPDMQSNEACFTCHDEYRGRLAEHTRHMADSPGSLCYNCHMPHLVYSLLTTHRSHRIEVPDVKTSRESGKPHACNLCHLDRSLGWTQEQLARGWPGQRERQQPLTADEQSISAALLLLAQGDARTRAIVAGAFSNPAAQRASGTDWFGSLLTRLLEHERYPAVRYLGHRGLRSALGEAVAGPFDYLAAPAIRVAQLRALQARYDAAPRGTRPAEVPDAPTLRRLLEKRYDPDVTIHE
jgi:predicted CXXCH cytochrome family protein